MNILVVSAADATNLSIQNVLREMRNRGHHVEVFARQMDSKSIRMFEEMGLPVRPAAGLTRKEASRFDVAFCGTDAMDVLRFADLYVFSYNFLFNGALTAGADFMFTLARDRKMKVAEDCATMPVGIPKNDTPRSAGVKKQFLFIDAGHIPFAKEGKEQLARMLLEVCGEFPEYRLVIKPRWLLTDTKNLTHANSHHIYRVLEEVAGGELPENLVLLQEHEDLQTLIDESETVITSSISCFVDAALRDKGVIVVGGLSNEDQCEMRLNRSLKREYKSAAQAKCLIDYRDVVKCLPGGRICDGDYIDRLIPYKTGASKRIVDVIEHIFENCLKRGRYPAIRNYDYETYRSIVPCETLSFHDLKRKRMKNSVLRASRMLDYLDAEIDFGPYFEAIDQGYTEYSLNEDGYDRFLKDMVQIRRQIIIDHRDLLMTDGINQAFLLQALYDAGKSSEILKLGKEDILCRGPYEFYLGRIYADADLRYEAIEHYCRFLSEANRRAFNKYPQENDWGIRTAYRYLFGIYDGRNIPASVFAQIYTQLFEKHRESVVDHRLCRRVQRFLPGIAAELKESMPELSYRCLALYAEHNRTYSVAPLEKRIRALTKENSALKRWPLHGVREKAAWLLEKMRGGCRCLREHGWQYTFARACGKCKESAKRITPVRIAWSFCSGIMPGYRQLCRIIEEFGAGAHVYLSAGGTGDVYISGLYYNKLIASKGQSNTAVYVLPGESCYQMTKLFHITRAKKVAREEWLDLLKLYRFMGAEKTKMDMMYYHIFTVYTGMLTWLEGYKGWNLYSLMHAVHFGRLPRGDTQRPDFADEQEAVARMFAQNRLEPGKTVVLAPYAKWPPKIADEFWEELAQRLKERGFSVCTNSSGELEPAIQGTTAVFFPYSMAVPFLEKAGYIVGLRSGFLDVAESADCRKVALYPHNCKQRGIANGTAMSSFSLNAMFERGDWLELETRPDNLQMIMESILAYLTETDR